MANDEPNLWERSGEHRVRHGDRDDAEVRPHNARLRAAAAVGPRDRVLDVGCGSGQTTREAARAAVDGSALGVDRSAVILERARQLSAEEGLRNVAYLQADAQVHPFEAASFDLAISRFGTMFFAEPVAAFANLARALRPGARLVMMVWQRADRNEWESAISHALAADPEPAGAPDPFSLADPAVVRGILVAAAFADVAFEDVGEPVDYGPDAAAACAFVRGWQSTRRALGALNPAERERALERLGALMERHRTAGGVRFDSRAWIVSAHPSARRLPPSRFTSGGRAPRGHDRPR